MANDLTVKQKLFVEHFLVTRNGVESAKLAGYAGNYNTLKQVAAENLAKPYIRAEIDKRLKPFILSANQVLAGLSSIAEIDLAEVFEEDGTFNLAEAKKRGVTKLIKAIEYHPNGKLKKIELYSAHEGHRDLGKFHGLFPTQIKLSTEEADKAIDEAVEKHNLPKPESFAGEPLVESEM